MAPAFGRRIPFDRLLYVPGLTPHAGSFTVGRSSYTPHLDTQLPLSVPSSDSLPTFRSPVGGVS